jgi:hypothetical protein
MDPTASSTGFIFHAVRFSKDVVGFLPNFKESKGGNIPIPGSGTRLRNEGLDKKG